MSYNNTGNYKPSFQKQERKMNLAMTGELALGGGNQPPLSGGSAYSGLSTHDSGFNSYNSNKGFKPNQGVGGGYTSSSPSHNDDSSSQAQNSLRLLKSKMGAGANQYSPEPETGGYGSSSNSQPNFQSSGNKKSTDENIYQMGGSSSNYNSYNNPNNYDYNSTGGSALPPRNRNVKESGPPSNDTFGSNRPPIGRTNQNSFDAPPPSNSYNAPMEQRTTGARNSSLNARNSNQNYEENSFSNKGPARQRLASNEHERQPAVSTGVQDIPVEPYANDDVELIQCTEGCGRKFLEEALEKHIKVCKKVFQSKRKQFNSQAKRMISKEQVQLVQQNNVKSKIDEKQVKPQENGSKKPKWQQQSEAFRAVCKNGTGQALTEQEKIALKEGMDSDYIACDGCGRQFNQKAAQKHIPYCVNQNQMTNIKNPPPQKTATTNSSSMNSNPPPRNRGKY